MEIKTINPDKPIVKPAFSEEKVQPFRSNTDTNTNTKANKFVIPAVFILVIGLGIYSGAMFKTNKSAKSGTTSADLSGIQADVPNSGVKVGDVFGSTDEKAFNTSATGVLDKGGLNGEGTHKLLRPGGASQTVYVTSSVIDLDSLVGNQVTIWGQTFKGQKTGWLMDVGRAKVETLNAPLPN